MIEKRKGRWSITNREAAFLRKVIEKQKEYLAYLQATIKVVEEDITTKEAELAELKGGEA